jgi:sulfotransferase
MRSTVHVISGLPRSGSTVLSALLKQNPRFSAAVTSPVASLVGPLLQNMSGASEFAAFFNDERRRTMLRGIFDAYYAEVPPDHVVFDTNRTWTGKLPLLHDIYPACRVICCVREIGWIIDSIERMLRTNPLQLSRTFDFKPGSSVYARVETLMNSERGLIGLAWSTLREAWFSQHAGKLIVINYETLVGSPVTVLRRLYQELGEPWYEQDVGNISHDEPDYDAQLGMPGMHRVRGKVEQQNRESCIPPELFAKYADLNFWLKPELRRREMVIL